MQETSAKSAAPADASGRTDVLRRAALVLISLDDDQAAALLSRMSSRQVEAVTAAMEALHEVDPAEQAEALRDFYGSIGSVPPARQATEMSQTAERHPLDADDDLSTWSPERIRLTFDPSQVDDWALALADFERSQVRRVLKALTLKDRRALNDADRRRGPWRLDEPHQARERIRRSRFGR
jgi:flagellar motor switch protein FliG